ncbi:MAG: alanine--glyoxylate aminotransferase family protein [Planctomycetes bacterium]|nr:alanine--glyoxylate aminotransferase family protein [Planctomycetota bacterium]
MKLWIPGPTEVRPSLLAECARAMIGHRSDAMSKLHERIDPHLRLAFGLAESSGSEVAVHTCSATGLMESSLHGTGCRVLCVANGSFSKRWADIAQVLGFETVVLKKAFGEAASPEEIERALVEKGPFDALTLVSNETSSGVRTPLAGVASVMRRHPNTLMLVDVVSYLAGMPIDFDAHGIDFAFAGSQKALALPPGITVFAASQRYLERVRKGQRPSYYLDAVRVLDGHRERKTPATPCIPLYFALAQQLEDISNGVTLPEGGNALRGAAAWSARYAKHERMYRATAAWAARHGLEYIPAPEHRSWTVSCIRKGPLDIVKFLAELKKRGQTISNGYGDLKDISFRIGHMGDHTEADLERLIASMDEVLLAEAAR